MLLCMGVYGQECRSLQKSGESDPMDLQYMQLWTSAYLWVLGIELWASAVRTLNSLSIFVSPDEQIFWWRKEVIAKIWRSEVKGTSQSVPSLVIILKSWVSQFCAAFGGLVFFKARHSGVSQKLPTIHLFERGLVLSLASSLFPDGVLYSPTSSL